MSLWDRPSPERVVCEVLPSVHDAFRALGERPDIDATEMSMSFYLSLHCEGPQPFVAVPVFMSRAFRLGNLYVNEDSSLRSVEALRGATVGLPEYGMSMAVWVRGILSDVVGISAQDVRWRTARDPILAPVPAEVAARGIDVAVLEGGDLWESLMNGSIDVALGFPPPDRRAQVRRLLSDHRELDVTYLQRTGNFPIMHTVVIRRACCDEDPTASTRLFVSLSNAKRFAMHALADPAVHMATLPDLPAAVEQARSVLGANWWPYGLEANRGCLETFVRYAFEQGLLREPVLVADLFDPATHVLVDSV